MILRKPSTAADAQQVVIVELRLVDGATNFQSLRPLDLDRRNGKKQRSWKIAFATDARLPEGFFGGDIGEPFGKACLLYTSPSPRD